MPPSGYDFQQASGIETFLRLCARALQAEARELGLSLVAGLENELRSISLHLQETKVSPTQRAVLELTDVFYRRLRSANPVDSAAFAAAVDLALDDVRHEILAIKVTSVLAG